MIHSSIFFRWWSMSVLLNRDMKVIDRSIRVWLLVLYSAIKAITMEVASSII